MKVTGSIVRWMDVQMRHVCLLLSQLCFASYSAGKEEKQCFAFLCTLQPFLPHKRRCVSIILILLQNAVKFPGKNIFFSRCKGKVLFTCSWHFIFK